MYGLAGLRAVLLQKKQNEQKKKAENAGICRARISGSQAYINGKGYPYTLAVDITVQEGQYVWCEICQNRAIIVGA